MKTRNSSPLILITALVTMAARAYGQQPPDVVTSDTQENTAMGSGALMSLTPDCGPNPPTCDFGNTAAGYQALFSNLGGGGNTAVGAQALYSNTTTGVPFTLQPVSGNANTAVGFKALYSNTAGYGNTAVGSQALYSNSTSVFEDIVKFGENNTAVGEQALFSNTTGSSNTATGYWALYSTSTGNSNTASGWAALYSNTTGSDNTAFGVNALVSNTTGTSNTASGQGALHSNSTGISNVATGAYALYSNTTGSSNTASGVGALRSGTTGSNNIAEGFHAGYDLTTGSNNIDIGNGGVTAESNTIRIGTKSTHTATYVAGIYGAPVSGSAVFVSSTGQLGVTVSSERFKTGIASMESNTAQLERLRPVTFHLKTDPKGALQYGLIAEEVAKVYPELVIRNESGRIDGVRYDELAPLLLNEVQQQRRKIDAQAAQMSDMQLQLAKLQAALVRTQP